MKLSEVFVGQYVKVLKAQTVGRVIQIDGDQIRVVGLSVDGWFWAHELEPIITFR